MKIVFLDAKTLGDDIDLDRFSKFGEIVIYPTTSPKQTYSRMHDADIIVTNKVIIDKELINKIEAKLIVVTATGLNNIDLDEAKKRGIEVKNAVGYSTNSVVQLTFTLALSLIQKLPYYSNFVSSGDWTKSKLFTNVVKPFFEISGKKWGIIGLGTIGRSVANIATSFGAEVLYYSTSGKNSSNDFIRVELYELLSSCDIISIHAPLNEFTLNLLDKNTLSLLKNDAILLNLGRGGIINESDLATIIDNKNIYVGLDVLIQEPIQDDNPLLNIKNRDRLIITPHIAWTSIEAREKLMNITYQNIDSFINAR